MSQHPTLRMKGKRDHRSVLKRFERIAKLEEKDKWSEEDSIFGLPKLKIIKIKFKKKSAAAEKKTEENAAPEEKAAAPKK